MGKKKLTRHNGRYGKNGVYNSKHNDRRFPVKNSEHIDPERTEFNIYWDRYNGVYHPGEEQEKMPSFEQVEEMYYKETFSDYCAKQNARNEAHRHPEKNRSTTDIWRNKRSCPEETIYQMGTLDNHESAEDLRIVFEEFQEWFRESFGTHIHSLHWALHMDEATPHIHEKHVFTARNKYGEIAPMQEEALAQLGFEKPEPEEPKTKQNNRKVAFDEFCRAKLFEIAKEHDLHFEEEPEYGGREYLEKQEYILMKQKEELQKKAIELAEKEEKLQDLTLKISDAETLIDEVADAVYEKAVDAVAETVQLETHNQDIAELTKAQEFLKDPKRKGQEKERTFAANFFEQVKDRIKKGVETFREKLLRFLRAPEKRDEILGPVKQEARRSITAMIKENRKILEEAKASRKMTKEKQEPHRGEER